MARLLLRTLWLERSRMGPSLLAVGAAVALMPLERGADGTPVAHIVAMVLGYLIVFSGAGLVAQGWREIYHARKEGRLATEGVYARMRHPQYTGLFLIVFGEGIVHWPTVVSVVAFPVIVVAYVLLARKEERQVIAELGDEYREYARRVPAFIPEIAWPRPLKRRTS